MMAADMPLSVVVVAGGAAIVPSDDLGALLYEETADAARDVVAIVVAATVGVVVGTVGVAVATVGEVVAAIGEVVAAVVSGAYTKLSTGPPVS
jgi:hypothetical protein